MAAGSTLRGACATGPGGEGVTCAPRCGRAVLQVKLLQELAGGAKQLQPSSRQQLLSKLISLGLFDVRASAVALQAFACGVVWEGFEVVVQGWA